MVNSQCRVLALRAPQAEVVEAELVEAPASPLPGVDVVALLLEDKNSPCTRRAYASDLRDFFEGDVSPRRVLSFLSEPVPAIALVLLRYKGRMKADGLAEATINRRLAAVASLLKFAFRIGLSATDGRGLVDAERARAYRDTRGIPVAAVKKLLKAPHAAHGGSVRGLRDAAMLRLLCENALRRAELCALDVADFDVEAETLAVLGKGAGSQRVKVTLSPAMTAAIAAYLGAAGHSEGALFRNFDRNPAKSGGRLTAQALYSLVSEYGARIGVKDLRPHKLRHSAITALLDANGGNLRETQRFSRHKRCETLILYDDNRTDLAGVAARRLSKLYG